MKLSEQRRRDRPRFVERVRDALKTSGGVLEPAAESLGVAPRVLYRWLCEPELRSIPMRGEWWEANDRHPGVRLEAPSGRIVSIDVGIVPLMLATWSLPLAPMTSCCCQSWRDEGPEHGCVQIGFPGVTPAYVWLDYLGKTSGWYIAMRDEPAPSLRLEDDRGWTMHVVPCDGELSVFVYVPREDLAEVTSRLRAHGPKPETRAVH